MLASFGPELTQHITDFNPRIWLSDRYCQQNPIDPMDVLGCGSYVLTAYNGHFPYDASACFFFESAFLSHYSYLLQIVQDAAGRSSYKTRNP